MMEPIALPHKVLDYACPINGIEDQYEWKTGESLPGFFLMDLSMCGFMYIKQTSAPAPRMVFWGTGTGKPQHEFLADLIGYRWTCSEGKAFSTAWQMARASVDCGTPVILGLLDMFHLPYFTKFYHRFHIPQHYVLLVGYDDQKRVAYVQDNNLKEIQTVPLSDLEQAWNVNVPGQGRKNTFFTIEFNDRIASMEEIVCNGLRKRAQVFLNPPVGFQGIRGMRKLAGEIARWPDELNPAQLKASLEHLTTFSCSVVPMPPQRLLPYAVKPDPHQACRDRFSAEIAGFAELYGKTEWKPAVECIRRSGELIGGLTDLAVDGLLDGAPDLHRAASILREIADQEEEAMRIFLADNL